MSLAPSIKLHAGQPEAWNRERVSGRESLGRPEFSTRIALARQRFEDFRAPLAALFQAENWNGEIRSDLSAWAHSDGARILVKQDNNLPVTGSIKARGGIHELLTLLEHIARQEGLLKPGGNHAFLATPEARKVFSRYHVSVASTGNLGYSVGVAGRAFGLGITVHMSRDAKTWKKDRLRQLGATVVEYAGDYSQACAAARAVRQDAFSHFVDDENSPDLFCGYAVAAWELAEQLQQQGIYPTPETPIVVYLPCGVGGAPGGITYGLKTIFGKSAICVFVEPTASPAMFVALASGAPLDALPSVYDFGLDNRTLADGLAVARASALAVSAIGPAVDGLVTLSDTAMLQAAAQAWTMAGIKLEPSAAAALAAIRPFMDRAKLAPNWPDLSRSTHIAWLTGGAKLPEREWREQLQDAMLAEQAASD